jgi:hypothetical protein
MRGGEDYRNASLSDYWRQVDLLDGRQSGARTVSDSHSALNTPDYRASCAGINIESSHRFASHTRCIRKCIFRPLPQAAVNAG